MICRVCEPREEGAESATQHSLLLSSSNEDHMHTQIAQDDISDAHFWSRYHPLSNIQVIALANTDVKGVHEP
jgi:hypothetical protein